MTTSCCCTSPPAPAGTGAAWVTGAVTTPAGDVNTIATRWTRADNFGAIRCRLGGFRMKYTVDPGLYAAGAPTEDAPVFVTANYKLSFDHLRRVLDGIDAWILVLDTRGINVWCAAGKGTFGTAELISRIQKTGIERVVRHRSCIVPQLGAPGIAAHDVRSATGFSIKYGPVRAVDIPRFMKNNLKKDAAMSAVHFTLADRLVLIPMELIPACGISFLVTLICLAFIGLDREGILFRHITATGFPLLGGFLTALFTGTVLTPAALPWIPFRAFSVKGYFTGILGMAFYIPFISLTSPLMIGFLMFFAPMYSSFLALNFTGSTPFTGMSGVKREMKRAVPLYCISAAASALLLIVIKIQMFIR